jgi:glutamate 5-kinase
MRRECLPQTRRIVVKVGSRVLTDEQGDLDYAVVRQISADIAGLVKDGLQVVLVSSGAVAAGRRALGMTERPRTIPQKQAAAAVGQTRLMRAYEEAFAPFGLSVGQILLTADDLASRQRFLNARATLDALLAAGAVPVINENDTVAVEEIKFGDNDNLSALVTNVAEAGLLLILTDIEGFYSADPRSNPDARLIPVVQGISREVERAAGGSGSNVGTGGMATKVAAAKKAGKHGVPTIMVCGKQPGIITAAMAGEQVGTLFLPAADGMKLRKHWIAYTLRPSGRLLVDAGARKALVEKGTSLLPSGVTAVEGRFERGACLRICGPDGREIGRGLADYGSREIALLAGHKSCDIEALLGYRYGDEVIHRDNLVLL